MTFIFKGKGRSVIVIVCVPALRPPTRHFVSLIHNASIFTFLGLEGSIGSTNGIVGTVGVRYTFVVSASSAHNVTWRAGACVSIQILTITHTSSTLSFRLEHMHLHTNLHIQTLWLEERKRRSVEEKDLQNG